MFELCHVFKRSVNYLYAMILPCILVTGCDAVVFRRNMLRTSSGPKRKLSQEQQAEPSGLAGSLSNTAWPCDAFALRCFVIAVTAAGSVHSVTRFVQSDGASYREMS
jgi:hypothetical protein